MTRLRSSTRQYLWVLALWAAGIGATTAIGWIMRLQIRLPH
jgi:hypothetical protein